ncbi:unnamed protein product [Lactuca virosa]|uniref:Uncharacterized protein n=1 Tax=Lactuca virosa TaxID=75947 RepID=A0AAU9NR92_9ASTR|nr:unnamed protein product [Lactuca virosa]
MLCYVIWLNLVKVYRCSKSDKDQSLTDMWLHLRKVVSFIVNLFVNTGDVKFRRTMKQMDTPAEYSIIVATVLLAAKGGHLVYLKIGDSVLLE